MRHKSAVCLLLCAGPALGGELTGRFVRDDRPVAGVTISAVPYETFLEELRRDIRKEPDPAPVASAVTNAKGEWRLTFGGAPGDPGKIVELRYSGPGVARGTIAGHWDTADSDDIGETVVRKGATLSGRVTDVDGHAVAGAEVFHPDRFDTVRTDADGKFVLEGVAEASNSVTVSKPGYAITTTSGVRGGAVTSVVLRPGQRLAGVVRATDGKTPVKGAFVFVEGNGGAATAETDAEGRFAVAELSAGRVAVTAYAFEQGIREVTGVAIPQVADSPFTLVLAPAQELRGQALDLGTRKPVAGAFIEAVSGRRTLWTRSQANGTFVLRPAPVADWALAASAPRYVRATRQLKRTERAEKPVEVFLREGVTISGRVTDEQRQPIASARVTASESANRVPGTGPGSVLGIASTDGTFTLRRVPPAEALRIVVTHPDFEPASIGNLGLKPGDTRTGVAVALRRGAVLAGLVTSGDAPLAGAQVTLSIGRTGFNARPRSLAGPSWSWPHATTGADGRFRIGGLAPGEYTVKAAKVGYASHSRPGIVVVERHGPEPLSFALGPEAVIAGHVRDKRGTGVADQFVRVQAADAAVTSIGSSVTLADGSFRIDGLIPGVTYKLSLLSSSPGQQQKPVVAPSASVELTAAGTGRVEGRVIDGSGQPVPEFQVTAQNDQSSSGYNRVNPVRLDVSSETGEFALENAPATLLEVRVLAKGYQPARVGGIALEEGQTHVGVEVTLSRGAMLRGRVVESRSGNPVPNIEVLAETERGLRATTDVDGAFEIEGLPAGKVRVTSNSPDYVATSEIADVNEGGGTVQLKLSAGASVSATLVSPAGDPQSGAEATLTQTGSYNGTNAAAGPDGRVVFSHLAAGRYTLTAGSAGRRAKPVDVTLEADQARDDVRAVIGGGATVLATVTGLSTDERAQASVFFISAAGEYSQSTLASDGRFEARDIGPGQAQAYARVGAPTDANGRAVSRSLAVPEEGTVEVELPFEPGFTLTVRVQRAGQPSEGARVYAYPTIAGESATPGNGTTDASGTCLLSGLKPGTYSVRAFSMETSSAAPEQKLDLSGDQSIDLAFPSGRIAGRVVASGSAQPLASVEVQTRSASADGSVSMTQSATTDSVGRFELTGVPDGDLSLSTRKQGYVGDTRTVSADAGQDLLIEMARGDGLDVSGHDGLLGTPLGSFMVRVFDGAGTDLGISEISLDSAGLGEIPSLKPGSYSIIASSRGFAPSSYDGVPVPGPALAVTLTPGGTLDISVSPDRLKSGPLVCVVSGPGGSPLAYQWWSNRGSLTLGGATTHLTNFPAVAGTLKCAGSASVPFVVPQGGTTNIAVK